jgi:GAF domain-containing protein
MEGISRQAGIALANARLVQELKRRQARLEALVTVDRELARIQPVHALLARIAVACGELFDANSVDFSLVEGQELVPCGTWGPGRAQLFLPYRISNVTHHSGTR